MKQNYTISSFAIVLFVNILFVQIIFAQGYDDPLTFQGLDHGTFHSAVSRAEGGTTIGIKNQAGLMFSNPASLQSVTGPQIVVSGFNLNVKANQVQQYSPLKYYSNFSLLMEGLTGYISDPDTSIPNPNPNTGDTVQRPFDTIGPNWARSTDEGFRGEIFFAMPFSLGDMKFTGGLGIVDYADMNHHYENHNVLSPSIGSERPVPVALPASDSAPFITHWSSFQRSREGFIRGYGGVLSGSLSEKISFGLSCLFLKGSTDDYEQVIERGTLTFYRTWFRLDSVYGHSSKTGTSDFTGMEFSIGGIYRGPTVSFGFSVKPPTTITRDYTTQALTDTTGSSSSVTTNGTDKATLPWRYTLGLSVAVRENLTVGAEYEVRSYASATYKNADGVESNPWMSSTVLHVGAAYDPLSWLTLRAGARQQAEVFNPAGNPLDGNPVSYSIYSAGCGLTFKEIQLNVTYEYGQMKYTEMWQTNVNLNSEKYYGFVVDMKYELPWIALK